jgi:hypothetical protein
MKKTKITPYLVLIVNDFNKNNSVVPSSEVGLIREHPKFSLIPKL